MATRRPSTEVPPVEAVRVVQTPPAEAPQSAPVRQRRAPVAPRVAPGPVEGPRVDTGAPPDESLVVVDVIDVEGRPADGAVVMPSDCPGFSRGPQRGAFVADPGACSLVAVRRDGALFARSAPATAALRPGEISYLQLELPQVRTGGIGVQFMAEPGGMRVVRVVPGTPAFEAGLEAGDLIVAVGDDSVQGVESDQFVQLMTGPEGTDVQFTLSYSDEEGPVEELLQLTRAYLEG